MGFRYRKSINLGKGFRVNMSKSGPGFSWGGKGFRITRTANGNIRGSAYIPGTGIGYQKDFGNPMKKATNKKNNSKKEPKNNSSNIMDNVTRYENNLESIRTNEMADVIDAISKNKRNKIIAILLLIAGLILTIVNPFFLLLSLGGILFYLYSKKNDKIALDYELSDEASEELDLSNNILEGILESDEVWLVKATEEVDYNGEVALNIIERYPISYFEGTDGEITSNVKAYTLDCGSTKLIFMPDSLFIKENGKFHALAFKEMNINLTKALFLEDQKVANDARVVGKTYLHTNKDGSADKRYKDNPEMTLVEYGALSLTEAAALDILLVFSDTVLDGK